MSIITPSLDAFIEENVKEKVVKMKWMEDREFDYAKSMEDVVNFVDGAIKAGKCVIDLETTGLNSRMILNSEGKRVPAEKIVGFGLCYNPKFGLYVPINHEEGSEHNLPENQVLAEIGRLCKFCVTIYHNAKFDLSFLRNYGVIVDDFKMFEDTLILARLQDAGRKENKLKKLSERILDQPMLEFKDITAGVNRFDLVNPTLGYIYGVSDAVCTLDLYNYFMDQEIVKSQQLIYSLEKRVVFVVMEMESNLIKINKPYLKELIEKAESRIKEREKDIYALAETEFNIGSPKQLGEILFDKLNYDYPNKMKTASGQYMTDDKTLNKIADVSPVVTKILEYRKLEKLTGTYLKKLYMNTDEEGFVKLGFNQSGTDTGRFSSPGGFGLKIDGYSGCNVQSIPKVPDKDNPDLDLRMSFTARSSGKTLVAIDYENEEMRVATNLSHEKVWADAVRNGVDFHTTTAALISGKDVKDVTKAERKIGKCVSKGTLIASKRGWIPIENLRERDKVVTHLGDLKKISKIWDMGEKPGIQIETRTGYKITCGLNHRFLDLDDKWVRAEDLKIGDKIKTTSCHKMEPKDIQRVHFNIWNKGNNEGAVENLPYVEIGPLWARLLGYVLGDGSITLNYVGIICSDRYNDVKEDIISTAKRLGLNPSYSLQNRKKKKDGTLCRQLYKITLGSRVLVRFFREFGFSGRKEWKEENKKLGRYKSTKVFRIPRVIFESPKYVSREFLRGLFETDGYVSEKKEVSVTTKDKDFAEDIQLLLLQFGIKTSIYSQFSKAYDRYYYTVFCSAAGARIFEKEINFISKEKREKLYKLTHNPNSKKFTTKGSYVVKWEAEIKNITLLDNVELMDLTIEGDHTYVAQGLITHNTTNFLSLYLGGPYTLAEQAKISISEAKRVLAAYFAGLPNLKKWIDREIKKARKLKYVKTIFGRTRPLTNSYDSGDKGQAAHADRCAINTQIQGASADIMKAVMVRVYSWIHRNNFQDDVKILITMHDELVFEVTTEKLEFFIIELSKIMMLKEVINGQLKWEIPLTVDVQYGDSWRVPNNFFKEFPELKKKLNEPVYESQPLSKDHSDTGIKKTSRYDIAREEVKASGKEEEKKTEVEILEEKVEEKVEEEIGEGAPNLDKSQKVETEPSVDEKYLVYTVRDTSKSNRRNLNFILDFIINESSKMKDSYEGPRKILKIIDKEGNSLMVSEFDVPVDCFRGLARFFRV